MPDLPDLCRAAVEAAEGEEAVEAYAEESRRTEASALRGEVEGLEFAESRGVGGGGAGARRPGGRPGGGGPPPPAGPGGPPPPRGGGGAPGSRRRA